jgi:hypothetical protein
MLVFKGDYCIGINFNKNNLETSTMKKSSGLATGRTLFYQSEAVLKNMKKALALLKGMSEIESITPFDVECKSGVTEEGFKIKLLDRMFVELKGKEEVADDDDIVVDINDNKNNKPVAVFNCPDA